MDDTDSGMIFLRNTILMVVVDQGLRILLAR